MGPLPSVRRIWIWTPWIPWILRIPIWWICLLRISHGTKAISCYKKLTKLPSMSSSSVTTFFSAFGSYSRKQRESKYKEINNEIHSALNLKKKKKKKKKKNFAFKQKKKKKKKKKS